MDLIPRSVDDQLGQTVSESPDFNDDADSALTVELNSFMRTMAPEIDARYHITVMNDDLVNAFALPDGSIIINTGILKNESL
ncbi:MAG: M48 family metalloprotease [Bacteroidetes bacterium]|nr:M48 family metalloprotease [Bacteroidota bacterium]